MKTKNLIIISLVMAIFPTATVAFAATQLDLKSDADQIKETSLRFASKSLSTSESLLRVSLLHISPNHEYATVTVWSDKRSCSYLLEKQMVPVTHNETWVIDKEECN